VTQEMDVRYTQNWQVTVEQERDCECSLNQARDKGHFYQFFFTEKCASSYQLKPLDQGKDTRCFYCVIAYLQPLQMQIRD
jgi:hypothetical protein